MAQMNNRDLPCTPELLGLNLCLSLPLFLFFLGLSTILTLRLLTGYNMHPGVEFSRTILAGIE